MEPYRALVNFFADGFTHFFEDEFIRSNHTDINQMRERVNTCLTVDDYDTWETWNGLLDNYREDIQLFTWQISQCMRNGLQMNQLLRRRIWEFVYRIAMRHTRTDIQKFERSNNPDYIHDTFLRASNIQNIMQSLNDGELIADLDGFRFAVEDHHWTRPEGYDSRNQKAWARHIRALQDILQRFQTVHQTARDTRSRPRKNRFAFIVAHILLLSEQMFIPWIQQRIQDAQTSMEQITER